jgi:hypothetical protein
MSTTTQSRRTPRRAPRAADAAPPAVDLLAEDDPTVGEQLRGAVPLRDFMRQAGTLTLAQRRVLVEQAIVLLQRNYVHLDLKTAMHAVNPLQRLRLLQVRLGRQRPDTMDPEPAFHAEMSQIFHSMRDLHTNYLLPRPYNGVVAFLPFQIEEYYEGGQRRYVVSHLVEGFSAPPFGVGVEVTHWNGVPIDRAVAVNAARFAGSNPAAQHSRGLQSLTIRPLVIHLPPDEEWVTVSYRAPDGSPQTLRHDWMVVTNLPSFTGNPDEVSATAATLGLDLDADEAGRAKTLLFAPAVAEARQAAQPSTVEDEPVALGQELTTVMPGVFRARPVQTASGVFGHIRIFTFSVEDPDAFVDEFVRLIGLLPQNGLIVDVRNNGGGHIHASEFTLQTLTPRRIQPEPVQFASRDLNLAICRRHKDSPSDIDLGPWFPSLDQATETGAEYSGAFPITPVAGANARGQQYHGPVVLITNARCYSATDIFAAGFADHQIGTVLGVDNNTGAGGANVWTHGLLTQLLQLPTPDPTSPYVALPNGANMRVSIRRTLRVGERSAGTPVEDLGVIPDELHRMTRRDVLEGNADLLDRAGVILAQGQARRLGVFADLDDDGALQVEVDATGIGRVDAYVDDRPRASVDVTDGHTTFTIPGVPDARRLRADGLLAGVLVASRTVRVGTGAGAGGGHDGTGTTVASTRATGGPGGMARLTAPSPTVLYVHGAGSQPAPVDLKRAWDSDLFLRDMGDRAAMVYYADILHPQPQADGVDGRGPDDAISALFAGAAEAMMRGETVAPTPLQSTDLADLATTLEGAAFAARLGAAMIEHAAVPVGLEDPLTGVLPLPAFVRELLLRELLRRLVPDAEAYFFDERKRTRMQERMRTALTAVAGPAVVVSHSLGTVIAYDVLREPAMVNREIPLLVTMGSPLGYSEIQDRVRKPLQVPAAVGRWSNVADLQDIVAFDNTLNNDFHGGMALIDFTVDNVSPNNHAAFGYLRTSAVRTAVSAALMAPVA